MHSSRAATCRSGGARAALVVAILVVALIAVAFYAVARLERRDVKIAGTAATSPRASGLPPVGAGATVASSPSPETGAFRGCPPEGDGGDRALNRLKNRGAPPAVHDLPFDSLLALPLPEGLGGTYRSRWPRRVAAAVAPFEMRAVRVEGYVARATLSGPESTNCHGDVATLRDFHIWLTAVPTAERAQSVIVEMTPRMRAVHAGWDLARLRHVSRRRERVRVAGWLLLDQEHPEQIGRTRGTIWEIHPVSSFEVLRAGRWVALDDTPKPRGGR